jgi:hypothetical protein
MCGWYLSPDEVTVEVVDPLPITDQIMIEFKDLILTDHHDSCFLFFWIVYHEDVVEQHVNVLESYLTRRYTAVVRLFISFMEKLLDVA